MEEDIQKKVKSLIWKQGTCVMATSSRNQPYCSLMAYATNDSCNEIYLMTLKNSRKYQNLCENPAVSLLIDTRQDALKLDHMGTMALTICGRFEIIIKDSERKHIRKELSQKHPGLEDFFKNPEGEFVKVIIESVMLVEGPINTHYGSL